ncbi:hypothetical protein BGZ95_007705 [Linnemannia exigua]|uniref:Invertebrate defensins family profile domain-containing protein n=1 Tax=Linnemannia exigua TaxID=604196 RepID=A0AAD4H6R4_9FUNG|nr:hypothetical protein BGZ95_007705 [Linnemannia exigua]
MTAAAAYNPVQKNSKAIPKRFLFSAVAVVAVVTLATPVAAGFGCPNSQACSNYCITIGRNGGSCGGLLWHTCKCNKT